MISKLELQSVIEKYHLNGLIENVKWEVDKNKQLTINFMSPTREMLGRVVYNGFPLPESTIVGAGSPVVSVNIRNATSAASLVS